MKIAFVGYPTQALLPPYHGSMGVQTYTIASALAKSCEVLVYGLENKQMGAKSGTYEGVRYRFFPSSVKERLLFTGRGFLSGVVQLSSPISSSNLLFPSFGRQVAMDLEKEQCDIIHVQHCSQYVPIIRTFNPKAKIVLQIHAEWFSQCNLAVIERRLRSLDLLLTVSDYLTRKTHRDIPRSLTAARLCTTASIHRSSIAKRTMKQPPAEKKNGSCILAASGRTREPNFCWMRSRSLLRDIRGFGWTLLVPREDPTLWRSVSI